MDFAGKLFKGDRVIWIIFMCFCIVSVVEVFSATSTLTYKSANYWEPIMRHTTFLLCGFIAMLGLHNIHCRYFSAFIIFLPISLCFLIFTLFSGVEINESSRWMNLFGLRFQPSELAKLSCIIYVAFLLSRRKLFTETQIFRCILTGVTLICAFIFPENVSTAIILFAVCFLMIFVGGIAWKQWLFVLSLLIIATAMVVTVLFSFSEDTIKNDLLLKVKHRLEAVVVKQPTVSADTYKINDDNRQETYAKIAVASGGVFGKFPGHGHLRDFLPQAYSDYIYAIIIEEMGLAGGFFVLFLYISLMIRVGMIARQCDKLFPKFLVLGCGLLITVQAFTNMAVVAGFFPVTGQPLPLISRGGTSTIITCVYFGIILSISRFAAKMGNEEDATPDTHEAL
ncbi:MAG: FtsW/RodA/SpoVE family cell cycle protein [Bacteroidales bacterium]